MDKNALIAEMVKWSKIARSADPAFELDLETDIRKALDDFMAREVPADRIAALEKMLREPANLAWKLMPPLPDEPLKWMPSPFQVDWFRDFIGKMRDGTEWHVPATGHVYKIDKVRKTFTLIRDAEHDPDRWHDRNKMVLGLLGYSMVDLRSSMRSYSATDGKWVLAVADFSIAEQPNSKTPGENFPPGSRGQDVFVASADDGALVRLGHTIARAIWRHIEPEYGTAKTGASWASIQDLRKLT